MWGLRDECPHRRSRRPARGEVRDVRELQGAHSVACRQGRAACRAAAHAGQGSACRAGNSQDTAARSRRQADRLCRSAGTETVEPACWRGAVGQARSQVRARRRGAAAPGVNAGAGVEGRFLFSRGGGHAAGRRRRVLPPDAAADGRGDGVPGRTRPHAPRAGDALPPRLREPDAGAATAAAARAGGHRSARASGEGRYPAVDGARALRRLPRRADCRRGDGRRRATSSCTWTPTAGLR